MDEDENRLEGLDTEYDIMTLQGSPTSIKTLKEAGVEHAELFVGVTPDESTNMNACILAHALGARKTVARIDNYEYLAPQLESFFKNLGIDSLIYPEVLAAIDINNGLRMSWVRQRWDVHGGALVIMSFAQQEYRCNSSARRRYRQERRQKRPHRIAAGGDYSHKRGSPPAVRRRSKPEDQALSSSKSTIR